MASISPELESVKSHLDEHVTDEHINQACTASGHTWRNRKLTPAVTIKLFVLQILHKNVSCRELRHFTNIVFSSVAFCNARKRLPLDVVKKLCESVTASVRQQVNAATGCALWCGHRTWMVDGTGVSMPDTPSLKNAFGLAGGVKDGCGFPVAHMLFLMDITSGFINGFTVDPCNTSDQTKVGSLLGSLKPNDVLVADRGFSSFAHFALLLQGQLHGLCRRHQKLIDPGKKKNTKTMMQRIKRLGRCDNLVELRKPRQKPKWMRREDWEPLQETILLRQVTYRITRKGYRTREVALLTTLLDPTKYPLSELKKLYLARWQIEVNIRHLKTTMGMNVLHCKDVEGVLKELWIYALVYNLVQHEILAASQRQKVKPDRISFIDTLDAMRHGGLVLIVVVNPDRTDRNHPIEPRAVKRRKTTHSHLTVPREEARQALSEKRK